VGGERPAGTGGRGVAGGVAGREAATAAGNGAEEWGKSGEREQGWIAVLRAPKGGTELAGMLRFVTVCGCRTQGGGSKVTCRQAAAHFPADPVAEALSRHQECVRRKCVSHQACALTVKS